MTPYTAPMEDTLKVLLKPPFKLEDWLTWRSGATEIPGPIDAYLTDYATKLLKRPKRFRRRCKKLGIKPEAPCSPKVLGNLSEAAYHYLHYMHQCDPGDITVKVIEHGLALVITAYSKADEACENTATLLRYMATFVRLEVIHGLKSVLDQHFNVQGDPEAG